MKGLPIYNFAKIYDGVGNVSGFTDSVIGQWIFGYDKLNRLNSANVISGLSSNVNIAGTTMGWTYDPFGNRTTQSVNNGLFTTSVEQYDALNRRTNIPAVAPSYDATGNIIDDGTYQYLYDADNRICAVYRYKDTGATTQYTYDASGNRVAKAAITSFFCTNVVVPSNNYLIGLNGEQLDEYDGTGTNLIHSNVYADGKLLATLGSSTWKYAFNDWLGTKRAQVSADGNPANLSTFASLPFGDGLYTTGSDATEQHFTGKERDSESGLDYFGARYYGSNMGRFMSPDWSSKPEPVPYSKLEDPQSLNLYTYGLNNPLSVVDDDGHFSRDIYVPDNDKHGGPHIDRYNKQGKNVGRYRPDGTPMRHKGETPEPVPSSDKGKFEDAKKDLDKQKMQDAQDFINKQPPIPPTPLPDGLKPDPTPAPAPVPPVMPLPFPSPEPLPPMPLPMPMPEPMPMPMPFPLFITGSVHQ